MTVKETNKLLGNTPLNDVVFDQGMHTLLFEIANYEPYETNVPIAYGDKKTVEPKLVQQVGRLTVSSTPPGAKIILNNTDRGVTNKVLTDIPTGTYPIRLERAGNDIAVGTVTITSGGNTRYDPKLSTAGTDERRSHRNTSVVVAGFLPGGGQLYSAYQTPGNKFAGLRGVAYAAGMISVLYLAYDCSGEFDDEQSKYDAAMRDYYSATDVKMANQAKSVANSAQQNADDDLTDCYTYFAIAGGIYLWQLADAWMWGGGSTPEVKSASGDTDRFTPYTAVGDGGVKVGIKFTLPIASQ